VFATGEAQEELVAADFAERLEAGLEGEKIDGAVVFVDLDGVASAESDVWSAFSSEVAEVASGADLAAWVRGGGGDLRPLIVPEVAGEQGAAHFSL